jgi:dephospho-CoA kinase
MIGLCGGIGAGKSTVAAEFERLGCLVIDSDRLNHEVLTRPDVKERLKAWFGERVIGPDGQADRRALAEIVFADPVGKGHVESLTHPLIAAARADMILRGNKDPAVKAIILNSPLLLESNLDRLCDTIIFIEVSETARLQRLSQTRQWDAAEVRRRQRWQRPLTEKRARSEFVVHNEGPAEQLRPQVESILATIVSRHLK